MDINKKSNSFKITLLVILYPIGIIYLIYKLLQKPSSVDIKKGKDIKTWGFIIIILFSIIAFSILVEGIASSDLSGFNSTIAGAMVLIFIGRLMVRYGNIIIKQGKEIEVKRVEKLRQIEELIYEEKYDNMVKTKNENVTYKPIQCPYCKAPGRSASDGSSKCEYCHSYI